MQELICSCTDVIPLSATDANFCKEDMLALEDYNDNSNRIFSNFKLLRNNNNCKDTDSATENRQIQHKILPNPSAVLKTVAALISMDSNPQHQSIKNMQQQHEFQVKLHEYQKHIGEDKKLCMLSKELDLSKQLRCSLLKNNESLREKEEDNDNARECEQGVREEQNNLPATCTKEQMVTEVENSNYAKFDNYDNNLNFDKYCDHNQTNDCRSINDHSNAGNYVDTKTNFNIRKQPLPKYIDPSIATFNVGNLYRHCKFKTFQKIKLNLITHHGNNDNKSLCSSSTSSLLTSILDASTLQTIMETDNDVNNGSASSPTSNSGLYRVVDEKFKVKETESSFKEPNSQSANNFLPAFEAYPSTINHKLLELSSSIEKACENSKAIVSAKPVKAKKPAACNTVSKRIEFFEHANIPNGGIIKPKSSIYSIYRVNDNMLIEDERFVQNVVKVKEKGVSKSTTAFLLRHDSHTLTIILSCVFILTFLLLVFFPLPG